MASRAAVVVVILALGAGVGTAHADPWYRGPRGKQRILHMTITAAVTLTWFGGQSIKASLAPTRCRWCDPPVFERVIRDAVVWKDTARADRYSTVDAYVIAPIVGITLLAISDRDASWSRLIDDTLPVAEAVAVGQMVTQVIKLSVGRRRPYRTFGDPGLPVTSDDNLSFTSGHAALGFAITAGAGMVCHYRHYWTEPYVWGTGIALSLTTEYLRMAADKHYLSDVIVGGLVGLGSGILIPRLLRQSFTIVPVANGAAVVGAF